MSKRTPRKLTVPFGMKDGRPVLVSDVALGLECGCRCPECGEALVARNRDFPGRRRVRHFQHARTSSCPGGCDNVRFFAPWNRAKTSNKSCESFARDTWSSCAISRTRRNVIRGAGSISRCKVVFGDLGAAANARPARDQGRAARSRLDAMRRSSASVTSQAVRPCTAMPSTFSLASSGRCQRSLPSVVRQAKAAPRQAPSS